MSHWNHRVVHYLAFAGEEEPYEHVYELRETHYDDQGRVTMISTKPSDPHGETFQEVAWSLSRMVEALGKPVIDLDETGVPRAGWGVLE
jgi:hypothetical protein